MKKTIGYVALAGTIMFGVAAAPVFSAPKAPAAAPAKAAAAAPAAEEAAPVAKVGDMAPALKLKDAVTGENTDVNKALKGKMSLVVFMNTGCSSCLAEMMELNKAFGKNDKVQLVAIAVDKRGEDAVKVFWESYQIKASYFVDPGFAVPPMFGFEYTPAMILLDGSGKIVYMKGGYNPNRDNGKLVSDLGAFIKG